MTKIKYTGALPFRLTGSGTEILLITTRRSRRWIIPKGHWVPSLKSYRSAEKEAYEEAGIEGIIGARAIGIYRHPSVHHPATTPIMVFPLYVTYCHGIWPEKHERQSRWVKPEVAENLVEKSLSRLIRRFKSKVEDLWRSSGHLPDYSRPRLGLTPHRDCRHGAHRGSNQ